MLSIVCVATPHLRTDWVGLLDAGSVTEGVYPPSCTDGGSNMEAASGSVFTRGAFLGESGTITPPQIESSK